MNETEDNGPLECPDSIEVPIDGILDLHFFRPAEVRQLVFDYLEACLEKDILDVRIIHGKGKGVLRETVHSILRNHPRVSTFKHESLAGSWGATVVTLKKPNSK